jgi:hypothetical protein
MLRGEGKKVGCEVTEFYPDYTAKGSDLRQGERYLNNLRYMNDPSKNSKGIFIHKIGDFPTLISQRIASDGVTLKAEWLIPMIESKTKLMQN